MAQHLDLLLSKDVVWISLDLKHRRDESQFAFRRRSTAPMLSVIVLEEAVYREYVFF